MDHFGLKIHLIIAIKLQNRMKNIWPNLRIVPFYLPVLISSTNLQPSGKNRR